MAKQYPNGVALAAHAHALDLTGIYLKRPPIYGENINNHRDQYWSEVEHFKSVAVFLFGVVMPQTLKFLPEIVERAFYKNPFEKRVQTFDSHTHAAIFAGDRITAVRHVLTSSSIREGKLALFPIESIVSE